jgi:hypothetical protein
MASSMIMKMKSFDPSIHVDYNEPRGNARGGKNIGVKSTDSGSKLVLQLPSTFTWGACENVDENSGRKSYHLNFSLEKGSQLYEKMKLFEGKVVADMVANSKQWFGKTMSEDVVKALFYPILKYPKDKSTGELDYSREPTLKVKLPYWDERYSFELYDMDKNLIFDKKTEEQPSILTEIPAKSHLSCLIECGGIWFSAGRCGVTWKFLQGKRQLPVKLEGMCMLDDSDEEEDGGVPVSEQQHTAPVVDAPAVVTEEVAPSEETKTTAVKKQRKKRVVKTE